MTIHRTAINLVDRFEKLGTCFPTTKGQSGSFGLITAETAGIAGQERTVKKGLICILVLSLSYLFAGAQVQNNTSLVGTVTDATGGAIVGAKVTAVNADTNVAYDAVTNREGYYTITGQINPGTYNITVEQPGFQKQAKTGVIVTLNEASRTDFGLKVGSETTELTVSANTAAVQTDDALLGETVTDTQIADLPMNGRNALALANIASNVTVSTSQALTGVPPGITASGAGTRGVNNSITLDGISIMNNLGSTVTLQPNPDALEAVQTQNGNYTAQSGDYLGIHINEATKAGTNSFHGTTYDYMQNDAFNSRGFNRNGTGSVALVPQKTELRYNLFGGVLSGPVIIPHLFNGRNHTFFTASYEGLRTHTVTHSYTQAFTPTEEGGDFSALLNTTLSGAAKPIILFSPIDGHPYFNGTTQVVNDQPAANAPIVKNILSYAALANVPGAALNANNLASTPSSTVENSTLDRIDQTIGDKIRLFGRFDWQRVNGISISREYVNNTYNPTYARNGAAGFTYLISPNVVNDLRGGFNWLQTDELDYFYENGPKNADATLGLPAPYGIGQANNDPGLPDIGGATSFSENESGENWIQDDRTYQIYDQFSWTRNKHSFMFGVDIRRLNIGRAAVNSSRGILSFASSYTSYQTLANLPVTAAFAAECPGGVISPATNQYTTAPTSCAYGSADASLFLGIMSGDTTPLFQVKEEVTQYRNGFFAQDHWEVSKKLTLDLGFRYELPEVPVSANGYARLMDPTYSFLIPPTTATGPTGYTPNNGLALTGPNHHDFGPHVGFAYRATDKIVLRGGGGIYYNANQLNAYTLTSSNFPFASSVVYSSPLNGAATAANPYDTLSNPTAGAGALPIAGIPGTYVSAYSIANPLPSETMYQWNVDNGIELWRNAGLELQYLGTHSIHLNTNLYPNQPLPGVGNQTLSVNARRPNQNFGQVRVADNVANATYNGLTTVLRQRLSHGLSGQLSYTWAHTLEESADANSSGTCMIQYDCKADWGNASTDIRHKAVLSFTYGLPKFSRSNFLVQEAAGGWQINGIVSVQSGSPFNVSFGSTDWANVGVPQSSGAPQRPNYVHTPRETCNKQTLLSEPYGTSTVSCVDVTAYAAPTRFTYGNLHRYDLHGPGSWSNNLSLFKNFKIHEQTNFQLRLEAFNAFNHANLGTPGNITFNVTPVSTVVGSAGYYQGTLSPSSSSSPFGTPSSSGAGRTVQIAGKINF
jgi:hypothetical protein